MFTDWKNRISRGWSIIRFIRFGLGLVALSEAWKNQDILFGAIGIVLLSQALLQLGCCDAEGCDIYHLKAEPKSPRVKLKDASLKEN